MRPCRNATLWRPLLRSEEVGFQCLGISRELLADHLFVDDCDRLRAAITEEIYTPHRSERLMQSCNVAYIPFLYW